MFGEEVTDDDGSTDVRIVLLVVLDAGVALDDELRARIAATVRTSCSPRHVPRRIVAVDDLPRTRSGKLVELAVADAVNGREVRNTEALADPDVLWAVRDAVTGDVGLRLGGGDGSLEGGERLLAPGDRLGRDAAVLVVLPWSAAMAPASPRQLGRGPDAAPARALRRWVRCGPAPGPAPPATSAASWHARTQSTMSATFASARQASAQEVAALTTSVSAPMAMARVAWSTPRGCGWASSICAATSMCGPSPTRPGGAEPRRRRATEPG